MRHLFIINPVAGRGKTTGLIPIIEDYFRNISEEFVVEITKHSGHAEELARHYASQGCWRIYSVGGDGTLNEIVNGMMGTDSKLCIVPYGSGNDYIKLFGSDMKKYFKKNTFKEYLGKLCKGIEREVDVSRINERYFLNVVSVGFDAQVARNVDKFKKSVLFGGRRAYIASIITSLIDHKGYQLTLRVDETEIKDNFILAVWGNGRYYGGGVKILPQSDNADGMFDICLIKNIKKYKVLMGLPFILPMFFKGKHGFFKSYVSFRRAKKVSISSNEKLSFNTDGEIIETESAEFEVCDKIKLIVPGDN